MASNYFSRFRCSIRLGIPKSICGKDSGIQEQIDVLIGQGKFSLGRLRLFHSLPSVTIPNLYVSVRHGAVAAAQANLHVANRSNNISVFGAFSRASSLPPVSGSSFQVCGYRVDCLLSEPSQCLGSKSQNLPMDICGTRSALADLFIKKLASSPSQPGVAAYHSICSYSRKSFGSGRKVISLRNEERSNNFLLYGYYIYNVAKRKDDGNPFLGSGVEGPHISLPTCSSTGTTSDVSLLNCKEEEHNSSSVDSSELNIRRDRSLKLNSGSCYLPHPDKEETGGEDAHFICKDEQAIGVADGVGGWAELGVDAGQYARELMTNSGNAVQEEPRGSIDPARVLDKAYSITKAKGSSTACIIALTDQGLNAVNLGDSGFMVVRDGCTVFRSPAQQHDFNYTYQLESGNAGDLPSHGQVFTIPVAPGDVIIAGSDGLFDNLYNNDITAIVVHAVRAGFGPQVTAQKIAALARQRALDKNRQTPFSTAAQEAGFRYYGGKLDDITVVVSYIASDHSETLSQNSSN